MNLLSGASFYGTGSVGGTVSLLSGGNLFAGTNVQVGSLTLGGLALAGGTLNLRISPTGSDTITVGAFGVTIAGSSTMSLSLGPSAGVLVPGTYTVLSYAGLLNGNTSNISVVRTPSFDVVNSDLDWSAAGYIKLRLTTLDINKKVWGGGIDSNFLTISNWYAYDGENILLAGSSAFKSNIDEITFRDSAGGALVSNSTLIISSGTLFNPVAINFTAGTVNYLISGGGSISGVTGLTKTGSATVTIATANDFSGPVIASAGTLVVQNNAALGSTMGTTSIASGASLLLDGTSAFGSLTIPEALFLAGSGMTAQPGALVNSAGNNLLSGSVTLSGAATIGAAAGVLTLSGVIAGNYPLTIAGQGTLVLTGSNTYSGVTNVSSGVLNVQNALALGGTVASLITVNTGAALELQSGTGSLTLSSAKTLNLSGAGPTAGALRSISGFNAVSGSIALAADAAFGVDAGVLTLAGPLSGGAFSLTKLGAGTLILSGSYSYAGSTTVGAGSLYLQRANLSSPGALSMGSNTFLGVSFGGANDFSDAQLGALLNISSWAGVGNTLSIDTSNYSGSGASYSGAVSVANGVLVKAGSGLLSLTGTQSYGSVNVAAGTLQFGTGSTGAPGSVPISIATGARVSFNLSGAPLMAGVISGGGALSVLGGSLSLSGTNSYAGGTTLSAGTLELLSAAALGTGSLYLSGTSTLRLGGAFDLSAGTISAASGVSLFLDTGSNNVTFSKGFAGSSAMALTKMGAGSLTLNAASTYTGVTTVAAGILSLGTLNAIGSSGTILFSGGTLQFGSGVAVDLSSRFAPIASGTLATVDFGANNITFASALTGAGGLSKLGSGSLTLAGANTLSGGVTLAGGNLILGNPAALGTGTFTLASGSLDASVSNLTLANNPAQLWNADFKFIGSQNLNMGAGAITFIADREINVAASILTLAGAITNNGSNSLTKSGLGTLVLSGANTFGGATTVASGILNIQNGAALGGTSFGTTVNPGATLQLQGDIAVGSEALTISGTGAAGQSGA
ncbi:MAG: hypothetical protein EBS01_09225, partial [Verrucomicrobia bacterium]|nr:hypothetical protein [Verrucomicrobiota bacterium]